MRVSSARGTSAQKGAGARAASFARRCTPPRRATPPWPAAVSLSHHECDLKVEQVVWPLWERDAGGGGEVELGHVLLHAQLAGRLLLHALLGGLGLLLLLLLDAEELEGGGGARVRVSAGRGRWNIASGCAVGEGDLLRGAHANTRAAAGRQLRRAPRHATACPAP